MNKKHKKSSGREFRAFATEMQAQEGEGMIVTGYATTFDQPYLLFEDRDGYKFFEKIDAHAFDNTDMSDVIMQYDHQGRVFARNKNGTLQLSVDRKGLRIEADLSGTDIGQQLYQEIKGGYTDKMSFAFTVAEDEYIGIENESGFEELRTIKAIKKLYDVSAVSIPANDTTSISARMLGEGVIPKQIAERLRAREQRQRDILKFKIKIRKELSR